MAQSHSTTLQAKIENLCQAKESVSTAYAADPTKSPGEIAEKLYNSHHLTVTTSSPPSERVSPTPADLDWARRCGNFADTAPSELFLHAYHDVLQCLDKDSLANCVSPSLCGTTGFVPMTIIAPLHDQLRHMSNLIVRARKEVLLATNFWKASRATTFVRDALVELSKRASQRNEKVVVKLMYDRGAIKQLFDNHQNVSPKEWTAKVVDLPRPEEIPNIDLAVVNFHRPPLGTFHSKFMIVDRQIATVSSNNIQDNDNVEMMSHLEGPIVDSIWETFLISWHNALQPPAPCHDVPAASKPPPTYAEVAFAELFEPDGKFRIPEKPVASHLPEHMPHDPHYDDTIAGEIERMRCTLNPAAGEQHVDAVARHLNKPTDLTLKATAPEKTQDLHFFPFIPVPNAAPVPMAMVSRKPYPNLNNDSVFVPQNEAFLSLIRNAKKNIFIQTPDLNAKALLPALVEAIKRGVEVTYYVCLGYNDTGELLPGQNGTNEMAANRLYTQLSDQEKPLLNVYYYVASDQDHPIHNSYKQRSCHIKLMIVDATVAIQGSGNQDTQSWYHSQEVNVMIDSPVVCAAWREGIDRNQNTKLYGRARDDGCWYDSDGKLADGSTGTDPGKFAWAKGILRDVYYLMT